MRVSQAFPSKYLKAEDLGGLGQEVQVTVARVSMEQLDNEQKMIVHFYEYGDKGLVLNKTNANSLVQMFGDETDQWTGMGFLVFSTMVDFKGVQTPAIRVKPFVQTALQASNIQQPPSQPVQQPVQQRQPIVNPQHPNAPGNTVNTPPGPRKGPTDEIPF